MSELDLAQSALAAYEASLEAGHPWLPGGMFASNPGLDQHILSAMHEFVRVKRVAEQAKPAKRVSLVEPDGSVDGKDAELADPIG